MTDLVIVVYIQCLVKLIYLHTGIVPANNKYLKFWFLWQIKFFKMIIYVYVFNRDFFSIFFPVSWFFFQSMHKMKCRTDFSYFCFLLKTQLRLYSIEIPSSKSMTGFLIFYKNLFDKNVQTGLIYNQRTCYVLPLLHIRFMLLLKTFFA